MWGISRRSRWGALCADREIGVPGWVETACRSGDRRSRGMGVVGRSGDRRSRGSLCDSVLVLCSGGINLMGMMRFLIFLLFPIFSLSFLSGASPWTVDYDPRYVLFLEYEEVPVIRRSTLAVVSPGWETVYYHQADQSLEVEEIERGFSVTGENEVFVGQHRFRSEEHTSELQSR